MSVALCTIDYDRSEGYDLAFNFFLEGVVVRGQCEFEHTVEIL